jgi:signal peptidase
MDRHGRGVTWIRRALDGALVIVVALGLFGLFLGRVVPLTGAATFVVAGASMQPSIPLGAAVIVAPVDVRDLAVGDVVSLRSGAERAVFTHRVIRIVDRGGEVWIETKGDANETADPSISPASAVIGRQVATIPFAGFLVALLSIPSGVLFVITLGVVLLVAAWALERDPAPTGTEAVDGMGPDAPAVPGPGTRTRRGPRTTRPVA